MYRYYKTHNENFEAVTSGDSSRRRSAMPQAVTSGFNLSNPISISPLMLIIGAIVLIKVAR